jgi:TDG/mug DNA glycosylase family protein
MPTHEELLTSYGTTIPDLGGPETEILLVGINPSLFSGWSGHHFARPGNRLWRTLHEAGLTPDLLHPYDVDKIRAAGLGITNLVARATARADELTTEQLLAGRVRLEQFVTDHRPRVVAMLGITAYRVAFGRPRATPGRQPEPIGPAQLWVVPNPSGLNAHESVASLAAAYAEPARAAGIALSASPDRLAPSTGWLDSR